MRRLAVIAVALTALVASGCGGEKQKLASFADTEGIYLTVNNLTYQIQLSRYLNGHDIEDEEYLKGLPAGTSPPGGDSVWFYPRQPFGRQSFAVRLGADGVVRGVEQRLTVENVYKIVPGTTQASAVRELIGPPWRVTRLARQQRDVWEYTIYDARQFEFMLFVQFSGDGVVREVLMLRDTYFEPGSNKG